MYTVGTKNIIVNNPEELELTVAGSVLDVPYYGTFNSGQISKSFGTRFVPEQFAGLTFECPTMDSLGLLSTDRKVKVLVAISVSSSRFNVDPPVGTGQGNPFKFEVIVDGNDDSPTFATKVEAAFDRYQEVFGEDVLPFTWSREDLGNVIWLTAKSGSAYFNGLVTYSVDGEVLETASTMTSYIYRDAAGDIITVTSDGLAVDVVSLTSTEGLRVGDTLIFQLTGTTFSNKYEVLEIVSPTTARISGDSTTEMLTGMQVLIGKVAEEAYVDGYWLEENITQSTPHNSGPWTIKPSAMPELSDKYTTITFEIDPQLLEVPLNPELHNKLEKLSADTVILNGSSTYTMYFNEATCLEAGGPVEQILDWIAQTITLADSFAISNGNLITSSGEFIA